MKATSPPAALPVVGSVSHGALELYDVQLKDQLDAYYDRTRLLAVVQDFVRQLTQGFATSRLVPKDVFAPLLLHFRLAEINAMELLVSPRPRDLKALAATTPPQELLLFDPRDGRNVSIERQIATFKAQPPPSLAVWGLRSVLERIPYSGDWQRSVEDKYELAAVWVGESETADEGCVVRCAGAFVGYEGFFPMTTRAHAMVEMERHVVVIGEQLEQAMTAFARQLIRSLFEATKKNAVVTLPQTDAKLTLVSEGAILIANPKDSKRNDGQATWTLERVTANRQAFVAAVKMALVANSVFRMDLLYQQSSTVSGSDVNPDDLGDLQPSRGVVRCQIGFFFHFDGESHVQAGGTAAKAKVAPSKNWSFVSQSRLHESGLFVSTRSAYDLTRRHYEQQERDTGAGKPAATMTNRSKPPLEGFVSDVNESTRSGLEARHWLGLLSSSLAFRLAQLLSLIDGMLYTARVVVAEDGSSIATLIFRILGSAIRLYQNTIHEVVEDASIGRSSSLLKGLSGILRDICSLSQDDIQLKNVDAFYQQLQCSREAIDWIFSGASCDFRRLVTLTAIGDTALAVVPRADLRVDIAAAIEERCYSPAIVAETVFAQYLVNTRLDVALERSLVNTVVCGLPPNPFVPFSGHLREFAAQFFLERTTQRLQATRPVKIEAMDSVGFVLKAPGAFKKLVSANRRLLQHLNVVALTDIHAFLTQQQVLRSAPYNPSKASYSARIFSSLLVDEPNFSIPESLLDEILTQQIEIVDHVVIEGPDHSQALWFFADAVGRDVQRLLANQSNGSAQLALLDPSGNLLTTVELRDIQTFEQLVTEATPKQCTLQITLPPVVAEQRTQEQRVEPLLRLVTKSYLFHHVSLLPASSHSSRISPRVAFRLSTFAVFMEVESARTALTYVSSQLPSQCELAHQTNYSRRASDQNDRLRLEYLHWISSASDAPSATVAPPPALLIRLLDVEKTLRWLLDSIANPSTVGSTPRSVADAAASLCVSMLPRIAQSIKRLLLPVVESMGFVDASSVKDTLATVGALVTQHTTADAWVQTAEDSVRRLWVLLRLVRVARYPYTDAADSRH